MNAVMDVQILGKDSLKIRTKKASLAVDPKAGITKFDADAILLLDKDFDESRVSDYRLIIDGPGDYEVSGLKISAQKSQGIMFVLSSETAHAIIAKASTLNKEPADKIDEYPIVIINADEVINESIITATEARMVVIYGEKAKEGAKALGKENPSVTSKASFSEDKLSEETEIVVLG